MVSTGGIPVYCVVWLGNARIGIRLHSLCGHKPMSSFNLGNQLNQIVTSARNAMFDQGELAQLTYGAFDIAARGMHDMEQEEVEVTFPVGYRADKSAIPSTRKYRKDQLLSKYQFLA